MSRIAFVIAFFFGFALTARAAPDTLKTAPIKLVYYVDETEGNTSFLVPFIETYLKDLHYSREDLGHVYSDVISLNQLFENNRMEGKVIDAFIHTDRSQTPLANSKERDARDAAIAQSLLHYDKFLVIKIHPLNSLLEYQFFMYDVLKNSDPKIADAPILQDYRSSSVFINPTSATYKDELAYAIKQVCAEVNEAPKAQMRAHGRIPQSANDTIYIAVHDTIRLEAIPIDPDSPKERFVYAWTISEKSLYGQINYGKEKQALIIDTAAVITIGIAISDGISQSARFDATVKVIYRPEIEVKDGGNVYFIDDPETDLFSGSPNDIRDDKPKEEYDNYDFLYRRYLFGNKEFIAGEDSLMLFYSKGSLHIGRTNIPDTIIESTVRMRELVTDTFLYNIPEDTSSSKIEYSKGKYATIVYYPSRRLRVSKYLYTFYAEDNGVRSNNLNVAVRFTKVRSISLWNEYAFTSMGARKGFMGMTLVGASWYVFPWLQLSYGGTYILGASKHIRDREGEALQTGNINSRLIIEFVKPKGLSVNSFSIEMQRFDISTPTGMRKDNLWGIGWRQNISFLFLGVRFSMTGGYHYFPNFDKKPYISGFGMFGMSLGLRYSFLQRKK
jgi:hypothetical protein